MKKIILAIVLVFSAVATGLSQPQVNVQLNIGTQPAWGPAGYDYAEYYYLPDIEAYYIVDRRQYVFFNGNRWVFSRSLPPNHRGYDLYHGYKVVVNEPKPWINHEHIRANYAHYMGKRGQAVIRDSRGPAYHNAGRPNRGQSGPRQNGPGKPHHDNGRHNGGRHR
jgi:hypothetical protein